MRLFKHLFELFYPNLCTICSRNLLETEKSICVLCRHDLPFIMLQDYKNNSIKRMFYGRVPIEKAVALLYYRKVGAVKEIIHQLKYKGQQNLGNLLGEWLAEEILNKEEFKEVDYIVPVPLHKKRLNQRGYNQVTKFSETLSKKLGIPLNIDSLHRVTNTKTQTFKTRVDRFTNSATKFQLHKKHNLDNKNILLVDDVITTGATLEACCNELLKAKNVKISIATMAFTE